MPSELEPSATVQRVLVSSPARFTGGYSGEAVLLSHAWPTSAKQVQTQLYGEGTVFARSYLVGSFPTDPVPPSEDENPRILPSYDQLGDRLCLYLAILFGKRFDLHGFLQRQGSFSLPSLESLSPVLYRELPFNSDRRRADFDIPLDLSEVGRVAALLGGTPSDPHAFALLLAAGRFYLRAIRVFQDDRDLAYLDLITCGEVMSAFFKYRDDELFDDEVRDVLEVIRCSGTDGEKKVAMLRGRLRQIKRRFVKSILRLLDDSFFGRSESLEASGRLERARLEERLGAAYDLRSKYLHAGRRFAHHLHILRELNEVPIGCPVVDDADWAKALELSPTFVGLERIVRYSLLRFMHLNCASVDPRLDGVGLETGAFGGDAGTRI